MVALGEEKREAETGEREEEKAEDGVGNGALAPLVIDGERHVFGQQGGGPGFSFGHQAAADGDIWPGPGANSDDDRAGGRQRHEERRGLDHEELVRSHAGRTAGLDAVDEDSELADGVGHDEQRLRAHSGRGQLLLSEMQTIPGKAGVCADALFGDGLAENERNPLGIVEGRVGPARVVAYLEAPGAVERENGGQRGGLRGGLHDLRRGLGGGRGLRGQQDAEHREEADGAQFRHGSQAMVHMWSKCKSKRNGKARQSSPGLGNAPRAMKDTRRVPVWFRT